MFKCTLNMKRRYKIAIVLIIDLMLVIFSYYTALILRLNDPLPFEWFTRSLSTITLMAITMVAFTFALRLHLTKLSSFDLKFFYNIIFMVSIVTVITFLGNMYFSMGAPRTTPLISGAILLISMFSTRMLIQALLQANELRNSNQIPVAIYGAGSAGTQIAVILRNSKQYKPILFVDDNPYLHGLNVSGLRVYKSIELPGFYKNGRIKEVLLAIPSMRMGLRNNVTKSLLDIGCKIQEVPSYEDIIKSGDIIKSLRAVEPEQLLGRDNIQIEMSETGAVYKDANILVSGGGGSIGSELCRKILIIKPRKLVILDISEFNLYTIEKELNPIANKYGVELVPILGSVCDEVLLSRIIRTNEIGVVLHAAAYKHVPLVEANIIQAIENNVLGTQVIARISKKYNVKHFTLISTDKAVRPTSVMGATKRLSELILQDLHNSGGNTIFSIVRFGNVLGSSGSVIPLFKKQIEEGGPVTVTHKNITRYFMTIPEAAQLVLLASSFAKGAEVFVLDMGKPIKIIDLAKKMIRMSGFTVRDENNKNGDIEIKVGKLRPGEKLYEELIVGDNILKTPHPKILCAEETKLSSSEINSIFNKLTRSIKEYDQLKSKEIIFEAIKLSDK